jgi:uncharacterized protein YjbI with pentapeptide repeats
MNIRNHSISNESIVLKSGKLTGLGPAVVLRHCRVECHITARELVLTDVEMHHCNFVARKQLTGYKFLEARFYDCAFEGTYSGCDFGKRAEVYDNLGDIARCDFSKARLDACRFFNCDVDSLNLATKELAMIVRAPAHAAKAANVEQLTSRLRIFVGALAKQSDDCSALVDDLLLRAKRYGCDVSNVEALARALNATVAGGSPPS